MERSLLKILHVSPTFSQPRCGIGAYTRYLCEGIKAASPGTVQLVLEGFASFNQVLISNKPDVVHVQLEYGFCSPERLSLLDEYCYRDNVKLFITFHSLATVPHNVATKHAIRLAHTPLAKLYGDFVVIPSGIPIVKPCSFQEVASIVMAQEGETLKQLPYLFFGQAHPHKQLFEVIRLIKESNKSLLCIASKPVQGNTDYYDKCKKLAESLYPQVYWVDEYLEDRKILELSYFCSAALFPYREYGAVGVSAAVKLLLNNLHLPIYTSFASHFSDLPDTVVNKFDSLEDMLSGRVIEDNINRNKWIEDHNFNAVAVEHLNLYSKGKK